MPSPRKLGEEAGALAGGGLEFGNYVALWMEQTNVTPLRSLPARIESATGDRLARSRQRVEDSRNRSDGTGSNVHHAERPARTLLLREGSRMEFDPRAASERTTSPGRTSGDRVVKPVPERRETERRETVRSETERTEAGRALVHPWERRANREAVVRLAEGRMPPAEIAAEAERVKEAEIVAQRDSIRATELSGPGESIASRPDGEPNAVRPVAAGVLENELGEPRSANPAYEHQLNADPGFGMGTSFRAITQEGPERHLASEVQTANRDWGIELGSSPVVAKVSAGGEGSSLVSAPTAGRPSGDQTPAASLGLQTVAGDSSSAAAGLAESDSQSGAPARLPLPGAQGEQTPGTSAGTQRIRVSAEQIASTDAASAGEAALVSKSDGANGNGIEESDLRYGQGSHSGAIARSAFAPSRPAGESFLSSSAVAAADPLQTAESPDARQRVSAEQRSFRAGGASEVPGPEPSSAPADGAPLPADPSSLLGAIRDGLVERPLRAGGLGKGEARGSGASAARVSGEQKVEGNRFGGNSVGDSGGTRWASAPFGDASNGSGAGGEPIDRAENSAPFAKGSASAGTGQPVEVESLSSQAPGRSTGRENTGLAPSLDLSRAGAAPTGARTGTASRSLAEAMLQEVPMPSGAFAGRNAPAARSLRVDIPGEQGSEDIRLRFLQRGHGPANGAASDIDVRIQSASAEVVREMRAEIPAILERLERAGFDSGRMLSERPAQSQDEQSGQREGNSQRQGQGFFGRGSDSPSSGGQSSEQGAEDHPRHFASSRTPGHGRGMLSGFAESVNEALRGHAQDARGGD
ncbi:MAG: hypothetical protein U5J83_11050 [Bryobacterales bacterium]|nr:hypothetical protein [Bryobacterales bacterium]